MATEEVDWNASIKYHAFIIGLAIALAFFAVHANSAQHGRTLLLFAGSNMSTTTSTYNSTTSSSTSSTTLTTSVNTTTSTLSTSTAASTTSSTTSTSTTASSSMSSTPSTSLPNTTSIATTYSTIAPSSSTTLNSTSSTTSSMNTTSTTVPKNMSTTTTVNSSTTSTVQVTYRSMFSEVGLQGNYTWSVTYNGITQTASNSNTIYFSMKAGNYTYEIVAAASNSMNYTPSPQTGYLVAGNSSVIEFSAQTPATKANPGIAQGLNLSISVKLPQQISYMTNPATNLTELNSTIQSYLTSRMNAVLNGAVPEGNGTPNFSYLMPLNNSQISTIYSFANSMSSRFPLAANSFNVSMQNVTLPYGTLRVYGKLALPNSTYRFAQVDKYSGSANIYSVKISKAVPQLSLTVNGRVLKQSKTTSVDVIHVPIINGYVGLSKSKNYTINLNFSASLLNSLQMSYNVVTQNGSVLYTGNVNSTSLSRSFSYNVPDGESVLVDFGANGNSNYSTVDPVAQLVPTEISYYVPITLTNSQTTPIPSGFQQEISVDSLTYQSYEAQNLQNVEFFYLNGTLIPSWLEGNSLGDTQATSLYTSANTVYWLSLAGNFLFASSSNTLYMGFAPTSTNLFDGVTVGAAPNLQCASGCPQSSYAQYDNGNSIFSDYFNGDTATSAFSVYSGYTISQLTGVTYGSTTVNVIEISGSAVDAEAQVEYNIGVPLNGYIEEANWQSTTAANKGLVGLGDSLSLSTISNLIGSPVEGTVVYYESVSSGTETSGKATGLGAANENTWWYGTLNYAGPSATSFDISIGSNLYSPTLFTYASNPISGASTLYIAPPAKHTGSTKVTYYYNWLRLRLYPPNGVMPSASFGTLLSAYTTNFVESGLPTPFTWNVIYGGILQSSASNSNTISFSTNSGIFSYTIANQVISSNTYIPSPYSGTLGAGNTLSITFSLSSPTCTISLNDNAINFGSLIPTSSVSPTNEILDTNSGSANANILVSGDDWTSVSGNTFGVTNTVWSATSGGSASALTSSATDTGILTVGGGPANSIYFGVNVPATQNSDIYSQTITIENLC